MMDREEYYRFKIYSFFHDPPDKALILKLVNHEERGKKYSEILIGKDFDPDGKLWMHVEEADRFASGLDREIFLKDMEVNFRQNPAIRHPLSGVEINLGEFGPIDKNYENHIAPQRLENLINGILEDEIKPLDSFQKKFLYLWTFLFSRLEEKDKETGYLWRLLPADTRMPNHTIENHISLVSALAPILREGKTPVLLLFTFGPIQSFIETSRKTRDLWASSNILARLSWESCRFIVEEYGPDNLIFPLLRNQPLYRKWLKDTFNIDEGFKEGEEIHASMPNKFLAIVEEDKINEIGERCKKNINEALGKIIKETIQSIEIPVQENDSIELAKEQASQYFESYWVAVPFGKSVDEAEKIIESITGKIDENCVEKKLRNFAEKSSSAYKPSSGIYYGKIYDCLERFLSFRKNLRNFKRTKQDSELKCSLCGEFSPLKLDWKQIYKNKPGLLRKPTGAEERGEELCAICFAKRAYKIRFEKSTARISNTETSKDDKIQKEISPFQPSTSDISFYPFVLEIWKVLKSNDNEKKEKILKAFSQISEEEIDVIDNKFPSALPRIYRIRNLKEKLETEFQNSFEKFLKIPSDLWYAKNQDEIDEEYKPVSSTFWKSFSEVREEICKRILNFEPSPYLAVLKMDGDNMGKWLTGENENTPSFIETLNKQDEPTTTEFSNSGLGNEKRPVTPAIHSQISGIANEFALKISRDVVIFGRDENNQPIWGHLIYSGGDDLLALIPLPWVLKIARMVRLKFCGNAVMAVMKDGPKIIKYDFGKGKGWSHYFRPDMKKGDGDEAGKVVYTMAMGTKAGISAGIAFFHNSTPLTLALEEANNALESCAKHYKWDKYNKNKDAFSISILKRSGENLVTTFPWYLKIDNNHNNCIDATNTLDTIINLLTIFDEKNSKYCLSPSFVNSIESAIEIFKDDKNWWEKQIANLKTINNFDEVDRANLNQLECAIYVSVKRHALEEKRCNVYNAIISLGKISKTLNDFINALHCAVFIARPERLSLKQE